jgi:ubiquinone/menaquinone biosynthesis C-methylase UbiE
MSAPAEPHLPAAAGRRELDLAAVSEAADPARAAFLRERAAHWDDVARRYERSRAGGYYHRRLEQVYRHLVSPGQRVLEIGCGTGDLLAALEPAYGVGIDLSGEMIRRARARHPGLVFLEQDAHELEAEGPFDAIVLSDLVNELWDVQAVLERVRRLCAPSTRVLLNSWSRVWAPPLALAEKLGLSRPRLGQNWLTVEDLENLLHLTGFEVLRRQPEVLWPVGMPLLARIANVYLAKLWPFRYFALTNVMVARPTVRASTARRKPVVSVVVPARNEEGNIESIVRRVPEMGAGTELIFVEGHSSDDTQGAIERAVAAHPERRCKALRQQGKGKGDAVRLGFAEASGDVLMILDADLTVPPEDLPRFLEALVEGTGEFVNGVRLVYPMEERAMRPLNFLGNKFFSLAFSWLLGQNIKDTLCGTKVLWRRDYEKIAANRAYFGDFDPFGDFDLIFGAAKQNLRLVDLPIRYRERTYGTTNISRFRHGLLLLRMVVFAAGRIKFV